MTYISLYRKYRPKTLGEVVGQDHVTKTLANALKAGKTSHAYLFAGPRGTGKTSTAKILAKSLNCQTNNESFEPCNKCANCLDIDNNSSVDVLEIDAASNRGIDEIRNLREKVHFSPSQGCKKVFIIDEVHMLTTEAFNALLKMIEEPPDHAVFILATTELHKVPPTIISRCQRFDFRRILVKDIVKRLKEIAEKEKIKVNESTLAVIASQSQGSVRDSIGLIDQLASFSNNNITPESLSQVLNLTESELLFEIIDLVLQKDILNSLKFIDNLMDRGFELRQFTFDLIQHFRSITISLATDKPAEIIHTTAENLSRIQSQAASFQIFEAIKAIDLLSETYNQMRFSSDVRLLLEIALIKLIRLESDVSLDGLLYRIEELEKSITNKSISDSSPGKAKMQINVKDESSQVKNLDQISNKKENEDVNVEVNKKKSVEIPADNHAHQIHTLADLDKEKVKRIWPVFMQQVKKESIPLYSLLLECHPLPQDEKVILVFNKNANFHLKEVTKNIAVVRKVLRIVLGFNVEVECEADNISIDKENDKVIQKDLTTDNAIKILQENFGAQVVEKTTLENDNDN